MGSMRHTRDVPIPRVIGYFADTSEVLGTFPGPKTVRRLGYLSTPERWKNGSCPTGLPP